MKGSLRDILLHFNILINIFTIEMKFLAISAIDFKNGYIYSNGCIMNTYFLIYTDQTNYC